MYEYNDWISTEERDFLLKSAPLYKLDISISTNDACHRLNSLFHKDADLFKDIWRINGDVPDSKANFAQQFPKVATSLDGEFHHQIIDHTFLTRWLPGSVLKVIHPSFADFKIARKLTAKQVPTRQEHGLCQELEGQGVWDRTGQWSCVMKNLSKPLDFSYNDEFGKKFFFSYGDWCDWKKQMKERLTESAAEGNYETHLRLGNLSKRLPDSVKVEIP
ncbi:hypothetical protein BABINDRAFT_161071 [Babjeviella inositovora NRRL Y-12698]|uniref:Uncharacterized protein n=1 Tax=Babjeviella inositovora NRRL Y-12698 TaxID=984486 RepID=A0A1E3QT85_9ASCO|nr:uncharacterized protein BABINDRAFT_161071 [Babjeviella inositovora NRRL Y-12698]ODQ80880.1 hypothetical protein BABINDRAFT_161071 [Babjeviella inositovora NRRL Y-12698]